MRNLIAFSGAIVAPTLLFIGLILFATIVSDDVIRLNELYILSAVALCVSAGHVILLGVSAFFIHIRFKEISLVRCISGGFLLSAIPVMVYSWPYKMATGKSSFSVGGNLLVDNGQLTVHAWLSWLQGIITMGVFGFVGGLVFWVLYKRLS